MLEGKKKKRFVAGLNFLWKDVWFLLYSHSFQSKAALSQNTICPKYLKIAQKNNKSMLQHKYWLMKPDTH